MSHSANLTAVYWNPHSMRLVPNFFYSSQATPNPNRAGCLVLKSAECVEAYPQGSLPFFKIQLAIPTPSLLD